MIDRRDVGSWLDGPPPSGVQRWPGERLGLPAHGPGSIARPGRRVAAICIDWALCSLIGYAFLGGSEFGILGVFAVEQLLLVGTLGASVGHRIMGLRLVRRYGGPAGLPAVVVRTVLLCLVIPAVVFDADQRGLHDRAAGTMLIRAGRG